MSKVIPKAGQVWRSKLTDIEMKVYAFSNAGFYISSGFATAKVIQDGFVFVPQSDLEFWAVEIDVWPNDLWKSLWFRRDERGAITHEAQIIRTEWQNTRYELGLDEKLKPTKQDIQDFMDGATKILKHYKDTKMIDLTPAKSGDKFVLNNGTIVTFFARTLMNSICTLDSGHAMVYHHNGKFDESVEPNDNKSNWDIIAKHDPRHWLSQLPDAGLFDGSWIACENNECDWYVFDGEPLLYGDGSYFGTNGMFVLTDLDGIKMPKLTGDEWKLSKISIVELRAWQEQNK